jgi:hypothetical protein
MEKQILLASFINPEKIETFFTYLYDNFNITKDKVFKYDNLDDKSKIILTFRLTIPHGEFLNLRTLFPNAIIIHKKGNSLYTINALNALIESENMENYGNINHQSVKIDWEKYQNKLILMNNNELVFYSIKKI